MTLLLRRLYSVRCFYFAFVISISSAALAQSEQDYIEKINEFISLKQYEEAKILADSIISNTSPTDDDYLSATTKLITIQLKLGSYAEGVRIGNEMLNQYPEAVETPSMPLSRFYEQLGIAYHLTQANEEKATSYLNQSLKIFENLGITDKGFEAAILNSLARSYYYGEEYEIAIATMKRSIALRNAETEKKQIAISLRSIGNSYWGLKDYNQASKYYSNSLEVLYNTLPVDSLRIGQVLHAKGYIHMDQENFQKAFETFEQASNLLEKRNPAVSSPMVWVYGDVGRSLIELARFEEALEWLQKALNANVFEFSQMDYYQNPPLININDEFQHFMILKLKGEAFQGKYLKDRDVNDLNGMIDCFHLADGQIDKIRASLPKAEDQSTITYYSNELYSKAISALVDVYEMGNDPSHLELAHYFMEKRKITRVHLKFLEASSKANNLLPETLIEKDQEFLDKITGLKSKLREKMTAKDDSISIIQNQLFAAQESYENFIQEIKKSHPSYHTSRFDLEVASVDEVQYFLTTTSPNRAIITYYNFGGQLRTSLITKDTIVVKATPHEFDLEELAASFRKSLIDTEAEPASSTNLNQVLIDDISAYLNNVTEITFIPDPALQLIPLELLQFDGKFLFETFDVGYHFSTTLFVKQETYSNNSSEFMGFAPSFDSLSLATLPGAKMEVQSISSVLEGLTFIGDDASELSLKSLVANSGLLHLATHAVIDEADPESSYLQFGKSGDQDGRLHFFEIYDLDLNAQLVTLSACNTGFGKIQRGEGVMSLSRAFAYAGVPATVVSLWPASDKSTPQLMKYFYENLKNGQPKDVALNNARKSYLANAQGKARHPFYWGGFVLIGDNSPVENDRNLLVYLIPSVLVTVIILTLYRRKRSG